MSLRVHLYGNVCNNAYVMAKFLRRAGVDAHLFLERGFPWMPEHEEPALAGRYPDWIHLTGDLRWRRYGVFDGEFVERLGACDLIHTFYYGPIWARQTGRPFVFQTYGGDLRVLPFMTDSLHHRYLAARLRRGIKAADLVVRSNLNITDDAVRRLRLTRAEFVPLPIDAHTFRPLPADDVLRERQPYGVDWLLFHPTRQSWARGDDGETWKANDRMFRGFARFLGETRRKALLLAVAHGPDVRDSQALVERLGIEDAVRWIPPVRRHELVRLYNTADLVLDQFGRGDYGGIALEAWACERPVVAHVKAHPGFSAEAPPMLAASSEEEIFAQLVTHTASPEPVREAGRRSREWVLRHHHGDAVVGQYLDRYASILAGREGVSR